MTHRAANQSGFTLVEMLVALAALALVATAGVALTTFAGDANAAIAQREAAARDILRLRASLKADLGQAAPRRARDASGRKPQMALLGPPDIQGETFLALVRRGWDNPGEEDRSALQYVEYRFTGDRIERAWRRHVDGSPLQTPQVLIEGVRDVRVAYLQYDQWLNAWSGSPQRPLPRAVRIDLTLLDGGEMTQLLLLPEAGS
jgi:general secretion pathway protein J